MDFLCKVCDRSIIENQSEYREYVATLRKKSNKTLYKKRTTNYVNLDEFDKIINNYISHHNNQFDLYFVKLTFELKFNNKFVQCIETNYCYNTDISNMKGYLLCFIDYCKLRGYIF